MGYIMTKKKRERNPQGVIIGKAKARLLKSSRPKRGVKFSLKAIKIKGHGTFKHVSRKKKGA